MTGRPRSQRFELGVLTGARIVSNTALRWFGPFLPTLERAFSASTGTLTGIMGTAELAGLTTVATGPYLDRGHERRVFAAGLCTVGLSSIVALQGSVAAFAVSFVLLIIGVGNLTVAGHAWIGHRVAFAVRSRSIGLFETSWALALLLGAPLIALLIEAFGWRGPYVAVGIGSFLAAAAVVTLVSDRSAAAPATRPAGGIIPRSAWFPLVASAATATAGIGMFVISGAWLDDDFGVSTGGLGLIAAGFGAVELVSSSAVAAVGDRVGARRSVLAGLVVLACGLGVMASADSSTTVAVVGLLTFLTGFEYGFISSLTLVTEAAPEARGRAIGISNACSTVARSGGVIATGQLYESFGIAGPIWLALGATMLAAVMTLLTRAGD